MSWVRANPGLALAAAVLTLLAGVSAWAAWHYGGLPAFVRDCAVLGRTGACPAP